MPQQYLAVIWRWMSTVFVKTLVVWCVVTLLAIVWARLKRMRPDTVEFPSPRREALLSLLVMAMILPLLFALNRLVDAAPPAPLLLRFVRGTTTQLLMCLPVIVVLIVRRQGLETVGLSRENLRSQLLLGLLLALVTVALIAAISLLDKGPASAQSEPLTEQRILYLVATFTISALAHEFIYRGYLQTRLTAWGGSVIGLLASSLIYSLWHLPAFWGQYNWITMCVQFIAIFVFGLLLGEIRRRTASIIPATLFHAANDLAYTLW